MEVNLLQKQPTVVHDSLLHIHLESGYSQKKQIIEDSLDEKKLQIVLKRSFDFIVSLLLIICLSPFLILTAILVKLTSKGPILYSNERVGFRGEHFRCFKFRSMVSDQSQRRNDYEVALAGQEKGILHKIKN